MARYVMAIDSALCMNCKACVVACQQRNLVPYQHARNWVLESRNERISGGMAYQPGACMHCDNPVCVAACPTMATFKAEDGSVVVDADRCIGCGGCVAACPYGARFRHPETGIADKCDYCRNSPVQGQQPACVVSCPTHCRTFGDADDPADPVAKILAGNTPIRVTPASVDTRPTLVYLNDTTPREFPQVSGGKTPPALAAMSLVATGVRWLGGLTLLGLIGVFCKQFVWPSEDKSGKHAHAGGNGAQGGGEA